MKKHYVINPLTVAIKKQYNEMTLPFSKIRAEFNTTEEKIRRLFRLMDEKDISIEEACRILQIEEE